MLKERFGLVNFIGLLMLSALVAALLIACGSDDAPAPAAPAAAAAAPAAAAAEPEPAKETGPVATAEPLPYRAPTPTPGPTATPTDAERILQQGAAFASLDTDWEQTAAWEALLPAAQAEGKVIFTAYGTDHTDAVCDMFTAETGIECSGRGIGAGQIVGTLTAEREAGEAATDVVYMSMTQMAQYVDKGYADKVDYEALGVADGRSWDAEGVPGNAIGIANNQYTNFWRTDMFEVEDIPTTVEGWLDPKFKGLVCAPSFLFRAGNGFHPFIFDADEMVDLHKRMISENDLLVTGDCNEFILSGERPLVYLGYGNPPSLLDSGVIAQAWNAGMGINMFSVAVASNAPNPNAARLFAAWNSSKAVSAETWEVVGSGWAGYGNAAEGLVSGSFKDVDMVFESIGVARQRGINAGYFADKVFGTD
jgi:hypothetical protein